MSKPPTYSHVVEVTDVPGPPGPQRKVRLKVVRAWKGVTAEEFARTIANRVNALPGQYETSGAVLSAMMSNDLYGRPTNYQESLAAKYRSFTAASLNQAIRADIDPNGFVWVVVGDAAKVKPQLDKLGIPVEVIAAR